MAKSIEFNHCPLIESVEIEEKLEGMLPCKLKGHGKRKQMAMEVASSGAPKPLDSGQHNICRAQSGRPLDHRSSTTCKSRIESTRRRFGWRKRQLVDEDETSPSGTGEIELNYCSRLHHLKLKIEANNLSSFESCQHQRKPSDGCSTDMRPQPIEALCRSDLCNRNATVRSSKFGHQNGSQNNCNSLIARQLKSGTRYQMKLTGSSSWPSAIRMFRTSSLVVLAIVLAAVCQQAVTTAPQSATRKSAPELNLAAFQNQFERLRFQRRSSAPSGPVEPSGMPADEDAFAQGNDFVSSEQDLLLELLQSTGSVLEASQLLESLINGNVDAQQALGADYTQVKASLMQTSLPTEDKSDTAVPVKVYLPQPLADTAEMTLLSASQVEKRSKHKGLLDEIIEASAKGADGESYKVHYDDDQSASVAGSAERATNLPLSAERAASLLRTSKQIENLMNPPKLSSQPLVQGDQKLVALPNRNTSDEDGLNNNESISSLMIRAANSSNKLIANYSHLINHELVVLSKKPKKSASMPIKSTTTTKNLTTEEVSESPRQSGQIGPSQAELIGGPNVEETTPSSDSNSDTLVGSSESSTSNKPTTRSLVVEGETIPGQENFLSVSSRHEPTRVRPATKFVGPLINNLQDEDGKLRVSKKNETGVHRVDFVNSMPQWTSARTRATVAQEASQTAEQSETSRSPLTTESYVEVKVFADTFKPTSTSEAPATELATENLGNQSYSIEIYETSTTKRKIQTTVKPTNRTTTNRKGKTRRSGKSTKRGNKKSNLAPRTSTTVEPSTSSTMTMAAPTGGSVIEPRETTGGPEVTTVEPAARSAKSLNLAHLLLGMSSVSDRMPSTQNYGKISTGLRLRVPAHAVTMVATRAPFVEYQETIPMGGDFLPPTPDTLSGGQDSGSGFEGSHSKWHAVELPLHAHTPAPKFVQPTGGEALTPMIELPRLNLTSAKLDEQINFNLDREAFRENENVLLDLNRLTLNSFEPSGEKKLEQSIRRSTVTTSTSSPINEETTDYSQPQTILPTTSVPVQDSADSAAQDLQPTTPGMSTTPQGLLATAMNARRAVMANNQNRQRKQRKPTGRQRNKQRQQQAAKNQVVSEQTSGLESEHLVGAFETVENSTKQAPKFSPIDQWAVKYGDENYNGSRTSSLANSKTDSQFGKRLVDQLSIGGQRYLETSGGQSNQSNQVASALATQVASAATFGSAKRAAAQPPPTLEPFPSILPAEGGRGSNEESLSATNQAGNFSFENARSNYNPSASQLNSSHHFSDSEPTGQSLRFQQSIQPIPARAPPPTTSKPALRAQSETDTYLTYAGLNSTDSELTRLPSGDTESRRMPLESGDASRVEKTVDDSSPASIIRELHYRDPESPVRGQFRKASLDATTQPFVLDVADGTTTAAPPSSPISSAHDHLSSILAQNKLSALFKYKPANRTTSTPNRLVDPPTSDAANPSSENESKSTLAYPFEYQTRDPTLANVSKYPLALEDGDSSADLTSTQMVLRLLQLSSKGKSKKSPAHKVEAETNSGFYGSFYDENSGSSSVQLDVSNNGNQEKVAPATAERELNNADGLTRGQRNKSTSHKIQFVNNSEPDNPSNRPVAQPNLALDDRSMSPGKIAQVSRVLSVLELTTMPPELAIGVEVPPRALSSHEAQIQDDKPRSDGPDKSGATAAATTDDNGPSGAYQQGESQLKRHQQHQWPPKHGTGGFGGEEEQNRLNNSIANENKSPSENRELATGRFETEQQVSRQRASSRLKGSTQNHLNGSQVWRKDDDSDESGSVGGGIGEQKLEKQQHGNKNYPTSEVFNVYIKPIEQVEQGAFEGQLSADKSVPTTQLPHKRQKSGNEQRKRRRDPPILPPIDLANLERPVTLVKLDQAHNETIDLNMGSAKDDGNKDEQSVGNRGISLGNLFARLPPVNSSMVDLNQTYASGHDGEDHGAKFVEESQLKMRRELMKLEDDSAEAQTESGTTKEEKPDAMAVNASHQQGVSSLSPLVDDFRTKSLLKTMINLGVPSGGGASPQTNGQARPLRKTSEQIRLVKIDKSNRRQPLDKPTSLLLNDKLASSILSSNLNENAPSTTRVMVEVKTTERPTAPTSDNAIYLSSSSSTTSATPIQPQNRANFSRWRLQGEAQLRPIPLEKARRREQPIPAQASTSTGPPIQSSSIAPVTTQAPISTSTSTPTPTPAPTSSTSTPSTTTTSTSTTPPSPPQSTMTTTTTTTTTNPPQTTTTTSATTISTATLQSIGPSSSTTYISSKLPEQTTKGPVVQVYTPETQRTMTSQSDTSQQTFGSQIQPIMLVLSTGVQQVRDDINQLVTTSNPVQTSDGHDSSNNYVAVQQQRQHHYNQQQQQSNKRSQKNSRTNSRTQLEPTKVIFDEVSTEHSNNDQSYPLDPNQHRLGGESPNSKQNHGLLDEAGSRREASSVSVAFDSINSTLNNSPLNHPPSLDLGTISRPFGTRPAGTQPRNQRQSPSASSTTTVDTFTEVPNVTLLQESSNLSSFQRAAIVTIGVGCTLLTLCLLIVAISIKCRSAFGSSSRLARAAQRKGRDKRRTLAERRVRSKSNGTGATAKTKAKSSTSRGNLLLASELSTDGQLCSSAESTTSICVSTSSEGLNFISTDQKRRVISKKTSCNSASETRKPSSEMNGKRTNNGHEKLPRNQELIDENQRTVPSKKTQDLASNLIPENQQETNRGATLRQRISGTITSRLLRMHLPRLLPYFALDYANEQHQVAAALAHQQRISNSTNHMERQPTDSHNQERLTMSDLLNIAHGRSAASKMDLPVGQNTMQHKNMHSEQPIASNQSSHNLQTRLLDKAPKYTAVVKQAQSDWGPRRLQGQKMPINKVCCHCASCSSSWLFRDTAGPNQCPGGHYNPASRGKLPFGTASSVLKQTSQHEKFVSGNIVSQQEAKKTPHRPTVPGISRLRGGIVENHVDNVSVQHSQMDNEHHLFIENQPIPSQYHHHQQQSQSYVHRPVIEGGLDLSRQQSANIVYNENEETKEGLRVTEKACIRRIQPRCGITGTHFSQRQDLPDDLTNHEHLNDEEHDDDDDSESDNYYNLEHNFDGHPTFQIEDDRSMRQAQKTIGDQRTTNELEGQTHCNQNVPYQQPHQHVRHQQERRLPGSNCNCNLLLYPI